jgi:hypothetical protein
MKVLEQGCPNPVVYVAGAVRPPEKRKQHWIQLLEVFLGVQYKGRPTLHGTTRHGTARHDTTQQEPACIHIYRQ